MTEEIKQCYRALDLEPGATPAEVKAAWRELVKVWHPDRFPDDAKLKAKGAAKLSAINRAFEILEAHLKTQQPSQDRTAKNKTSREYRPGSPPKDQKESQPKKPSKAVAIYVGAMIVGSLFIGLDVLRVSLAEKREEGQARERRSRTVALGGNAGAAKKRGGSQGTETEAGAHRRLSSPRNS